MPDHPTVDERAGDLLDALLAELTRDSDSDSDSDDDGGDDTDTDTEPGLTEERVIELIEEHPQPGGGFDPDTLALLDQLITDSSTTLHMMQRELGTRGETWHAGPTEPTVDATHTTPLWGLRFETDRPIYLGDTIIKAAEDGQVTARAYTFDDDAYEITGLAAERELDLVEGENRVTLGFHLPPGYYLLTRPVTDSREEASDVFADQPDEAFAPGDDLIALARESYDLTDTEDQHGVTFHGIRNPVWPGASAGQWYYFYNLQITADPDEDPEFGEDEAEADE